MIIEKQILAHTDIRWMLAFSGVSQVCGTFLRCHDRLTGQLKKKDPVSYFHFPSLGCLETNISIFG